mmetsp:Transcript_7852/g.31083  ORF Transcript_7852/g.31083 Transcript_7852/m.31083 type:complete len:207 (-) Transcript_7852:3090-3710(-)
MRKNQARMKIPGPSTRSSRPSATAPASFTKIPTHRGEGEGREGGSSSASRRSRPSAKLPSSSPRRRLSPRMVRPLAPARAPVGGSARTLNGPRGSCSSRFKTRGSTRGRRASRANPGRWGFCGAARGPAAPSSTIRATILLLPRLPRRRRRRRGGPSRHSSWRPWSRYPRRSPGASARTRRRPARRRRAPRLTPPAARRASERPAR